MVKRRSYRQSGGWRRPTRTTRVSAKTKHSRDLHSKGRKTKKGKKQKWAVGTRAQVSRGSADHTRSGLKLGNGLKRDRDGRIKSVAVSEQSKAKFRENPEMQARSALVSLAFEELRNHRHSRTKKINSTAVMRDPEDALMNPEKYFLRK